MTSQGDYKKTTDFLNKLASPSVYDDLDRFGQMGVAALSQATPKDTGLSASSWGYRIIRSARRPGIEWFNTDKDVNGTPIVILIQYGHGTGTGGYVQGRDFINPTMRPLFDKFADEIWKKVKS